MTRSELFGNIEKKKSFLCVGLDTDITKIPKHLLKTEDPVFEFNKQIIDATHDLCVAYKPNMAFYETEGATGWISLEKTINYINQTYKTIFTIADAKRGDIGNTSKMYAKAFLKNLNFDSITVAPYMGEDSVTPFLEYKNKWVILLALTSNTGALDFQMLELNTHFDGEGEILFQKVLETSKEWGSLDNMMYVVGATKAEMFTDIRKIIPEHFLLVPGVGAQGGSLQDVAKYGMNKQCGLLVNSSRGIIYAGSDEDFADKARAEAMKLQKEMKLVLKKYL
ncbi:MAG: orotidine 5'-phosphate decarboxylase [Bacteroidetes bacterium RIFCSPLOWO2_12_FULL_35_15]|nr:MAG: orotidine 5'-phosphate decarboxylase [Bacteroidetes bacterium RIFCSPLOWO2_12_FULL_35_15]